MKITKMYDETDARRAKANIGCNVCPKCGENKTDFDYVNEALERNEDIPLGRGIIQYGYYDTSKGLFRLTGYQTDCYKCLTCGAEWESDPYIVYDESQEPSLFRKIIDAIGGKI